MLKEKRIKEFLKDRKEQWLTAKEIAQGIDYSLISVKNSLKRLKESKEIDYQETAERGNPLRYRFRKNKK